MMKPTLQIRFSLITVLATALAACSNRDEVISVESDDPEMATAIAKARETLPQLWQIFDKREHGESGFSLKLRITDQNGTEHFWVDDIERRDGKTMGTIDNEPNTVASVKLGDRIDVPEAEITDWFYLLDGKIVGNYTLRPLFKTMPSEEVARLKGMLAVP